MTIATAIENARQKIANAYAKIESMGGTLPATQDLEHLPVAIESSSGSLIDGSIESIDTSLSSVRGGAFANCKNLTSVTLRSNTLVDLTDESIFENTPIENFNNFWVVATENTNLGSNSWQSIAYGNNKFVALGFDGYISTSEDGINWTEAVQNTNLNPDNWRSIAYGDNKFVALSYYGYTSTSEDGINWTEAVQNTNLGSNSWDSIAYGNNKFVALGLYGYISTSEDGINWTEAVQSTNLGSNSWYSIAYGDNKFVALGSRGYISTSEDGINWTEAVQNTNLGENGWYSIAYGNNKFVALSYYGYSSTSIDGIDWKVATYRNNLGSNNWESIACGNNKFVTLGIGGYISSNWEGSIYIPSNLVDDYKRKTRKYDTYYVNPYVQGLSFGNNKFVSCSNGYTSGKGIMYSSSGMEDSWIAVSSSNISNKNWGAITYGNGMFVAFTNNASSSTGYVTYSSNGISWATPIDIGTRPYKYVTYGNGIFVALGNRSDDTIISTDGITWNSVTPSQTFTVSDVAYGNGRFIAIQDLSSSNIKAYETTDGINWSLVGQFSFDVICITYGNGKFVVAGAGGYVTTLEDGSSSWTTPIRIGSDYSWWDKIICGDGLFVLGGHIRDSVTGDVNCYACSSEDAVNWTTPVKLVDSHDLSGTSCSAIAFGNGKFLIGQEGSQSFISQNTIMYDFLPISEQQS